MMLQLFQVLIGHSFIFREASIQILLFILKNWAVLLFVYKIHMRFINSVFLFLKLSIKFFILTKLNSSIFFFYEECPEIFAYPQAVKIFFYVFF